MTHAFKLLMSLALFAGASGLHDVDTLTPTVGTGDETKELMERRWCGWLLPPPLPSRERGQQLFTLRAPAEARPEARIRFLLGYPLFLRSFGKNLDFRGPQT